VRSWPERLVTAGRVVWFYLDKLAWPHPLIFIYPRWKIDAGQWVSYMPLLALILVLFLLWRARVTWARSCFFALAYFVAALLPVLGLVDQYFLRYSFVGDHFQYLASMGPLALAGATISIALGSLQEAPRFLKPAVVTTLLVTLGVMTWSQCSMYQDRETLWRTTISRNSDCAIAHNNLGEVLAESGRLPEALNECETALRLEPNYAEVHGAVGNILLQSGQVSEAIQQFKTAIQINPDYAKAHNALGNALLQAGHIEEAIDQYKTTIQIEPDFAEAHNNLGAVFLQTGQVQEAIRECVDALQINPDYAEAHNNLGDALLHAGRISEAIEQCTLSIKITPDSAEAHYNLGNALFLANRLPEAITQYETAIQIKPNYAWAHANVGTVLLQMGRKDEAKAHYERALQIDPNFQPAQKALNALNVQGAAGVNPASAPASH
jgi:tetratricopeptide (TPR) repeat protein